MESLPVKVLIVEDNPNQGKLLKTTLVHFGYTIDLVMTGEEGMDCVNKNVYDLVIADYMLSGLTGDEILKHVSDISPYTATMLITANAKVHHAVELLQHGIDDYVEKPFNVKNVLARIERLLEKQKLRRQIDILQKQVQNRSGSETIIGNSEKIQKVLQQIDVVANAQVPVVIEGESGVGKELVARAIHYGSNRASNPFIAINCGALPETLLESELFGHVKGAFTGADRHVVGLIQGAGGGSLLLDEVTEMSLTTQVKLLRTLQENEIRRVGSNESIKVDVRFIAATNRNLEEEVAAGRFREDLYYRLNVMNIHVPSLRERKEDIPLLARNFLERYTKKFGKSITDFSAAAMQKLMQGEWVGNVRELENVIQRAVLVANTSVILPEDIEGVSGQMSPPETDFLVSLLENEHFSTLDELLQTIECQKVQEALIRNNWHKTNTVKELGINRMRLDRIIKRCHLKKEDE